MKLVILYAEDGDASEWGEHVVHFPSCDPEERDCSVAGEAAAAAAVSAVRDGIWIYGGLTLVPPHRIWEATIMEDHEE
jgi:hypothetical protein